MRQLSRNAGFPLYNRVGNQHPKRVKTEQTPQSRCPACREPARGKFCNACGAALSGRQCANCETSLPPGARFCNACGHAVSDGRDASGPRRKGAAPAAAAAAPENRTLSYLPWAVAAVGLVAVVAYVAGGGGAAAAPSSGATAAVNAPFANGGGSGAAPDISSLSPRERAARLYDRIMRYAEEGKTDSLQVFAPMAIASFEMLGADLDLHARYDLGRVALEAGQLNVAVAQADTILKSSPTHLLGLALQARTADREKNSAAAKRSWSAFLSAKDAELKKNLEEYQAHAADIDVATRVARGGS